MPLDESRLEALVAGRPRSFSIELSRRARRNRARNLRHESPRTKTPRPRMAQTPSRRCHTQLRHSPPQHRSAPRNARSRRILQRQPRRVRQRSVLRLGFRQPRFPSPTREQLTQSIDFLKKAQERLSGKIKWNMSFPITTRNIQSLAWAAGAKTDAHHSERRCASLPRRARDSWPVLRKCEEPRLAGNLGEIRCVPKIPRRSLDARTLQNLRPPRTGFRRLPLPSFSSRWRRHGHRPRLLAFPAAPQSRRNPHEINS